MRRGISRSVRPALAGLAALASLAGCAAGAAGGAPGARRDLAWQVASTEHVELWTDLDPAASRRLAARLEGLQRTLSAALGGAGAPPLRARVVLLPDRAALASLAGPGVAGFSTVLTDAPTVVTDAARALADPAVLAHELTHLLVARRMVRPPPWLDEGLAEALETAAAPGVAPGTVGAVPAWVRPGWRPAPGFVRRLLAWDGRPDPGAPRRDASAAWLLVHFLRHEEPARLDDLVRRLEAGQAGASAWRAAFPEWSDELLLGPHRLEARVLAFLERPPPPPRRWPEEPPTEVALRRASPADVRLLWLELPRREHHTPGALRDEVVASLRLSPDHPVALRWLAQLDGLPPLPLARRAVAAHPGDWRAWSFLGAALRSAGAPPVAREEALRRAAELAPDRAGSLSALADHLAAERRSAEAAPLARLALERRPWDPAVLDLYARVALEQGECPVVPDAARRLGPLVGGPGEEGTPPGGQAGAEERRRRAQALDQLERRCDLARFAAGAFPTLEARAGAALLTAQNEFSIPSSW